MHNRRTFLTATTGAAAVAALSSTTLTAADEALPIVDCHQHLWDLKQFRLPWIEKGSLLDRNYVSQDYDEAAKGLNIAQAVYMEVDVALDQKQAEADYLEKLCAGGKTVTKAAVVGGDLSKETFADYAWPLANAKAIKGVRQVLHGLPKGACLADVCRKRETARQARPVLRLVHPAGGVGRRTQACRAVSPTRDSSSTTAAMPT